MCKCVCVPVFLRLRVCVYVFVCMCVCVPFSAPMSVCLSVSLSVCLNVFLSLPLFSLTVSLSLCVRVCVRSFVCACMRVQHTQFVCCAKVISRSSPPTLGCSPRPHPRRCPAQYCGRRPSESRPPAAGETIKQPQQTCMRAHTPQALQHFHTNLFNPGAESRTSIDHHGDVDFPGVVALEHAADACNSVRVPK